MNQPETQVASPEFGEDFTLNYERKTNSSNTFRENLEAELPEGKNRILVLPGGAMRGIYSAAALRAIEEAGFGPSTFDKIVGVSAGALNGAYYAGGVNKLSLDAWMNHVPSKEFIRDKWLPFGSVDIDHLHDEILATHAPLSAEAVRLSKSELLVGLTELETGDSVFFSTRDDVSVHKLLKASSALPILFDNPVELNGSLYVDGGASATIPLEETFKHEPAHIVIIANNPLSHRRSAGGVGHYAALHLIGGFFGGYSRETRNQFNIGARNYNLMKDFLSSLDSYENSEITIDAFFPDENKVINQQELNKKVLAQAAEETRMTFRHLLSD